MGHRGRRSTFDRASMRTEEILLPGRFQHASASPVGSPESLRVESVPTKSVMAVWMVEFDAERWSGRGFQDGRRLSAWADDAESGVWCAGLVGVGGGQRWLFQ